MYGVNSISGIPEPVGPRRQDSRNAAATTDVTTPQDGVKISPEAQQAASVAKLLEASKQADEIRSAKVAQARKNLEEGTYRVQATVLQLASRISPYVG